MSWDIVIAGVVILLVLEWVLPRFRQFMNRTQPWAGLVILVMMAVRYVSGYMPEEWYYRVFDIFIIIVATRMMLPLFERFRR